MKTRRVIGGIATIAAIGLLGAGALALASSAAPASLTSFARTDSAPSVSAPSGLLESVPASEEAETLAGLPCPNGQLPLLEIAAFPQAHRGGAETPEAAVRAAANDVCIVSQQRLGVNPRAPAWLVTDHGTFMATTLSDGTWFAATATLVKCQSG